MVLNLAHLLYYSGHAHDQELESHNRARVDLHEVCFLTVTTAVATYNITLFSPEDGRFVLSAIRLGSRGDSYYEYLL